MRTQVESVDWKAVTAVHSLSDTIFFHGLILCHHSLQEKISPDPIMIKFYYFFCYNFWKNSLDNNCVGQ